MKVTILGCGTSSGVPRIGNDWGACDPTEPRNARTRASILIRSETTSILVDTGPDMRAQLLAAEVEKVDAVIWTHEHADHTHGIDDLRQIFHASGAPVPGYARPETLGLLTERFRYVFAGRGGYPATVDGRPLPDALMIGDIAVRVAEQPHGPIMSAGLRFDHDDASIGYATDCSNFTTDMDRLYEDLDLWVVDALRARPHPTHAHLTLTLDAIARIQPRRALLTHMDQSMDYHTLRAMLPDGIEPAYDGQTIDLS